MRPKLPPHQKRVPCQAKVDPSTSVFLDQLAEASRGRAIDTLVAAVRSAYTPEEIARLREFNRVLNNGGGQP